MPIELVEIYALIGIHAVWVLLPLVPAILIYRLFPNTAVGVSGPLANLSVRASGAFAAYLIVFVFTYPLVRSHDEKIAALQHTYWRIKGQIELLDKDGKPREGDYLLRKMVLQTNPPPNRVESDYVEINIPAPFPLLILEIPDFGRTVIDLSHLRSQSGVVVDEYNKVIELKTPIAIKETNRVSAGRIVYDPRPQTDRADRER
jgi:hypothetical protein